MDKIWIGWMAGILDGEGSIQMIKGIDKSNKDKPYIRCKITIVNTDYNLLDKFDDLVFEMTGCRMNQYTIKGNETDRERKTYGIYKQEIIKKVLQILYPYLIAKKDRALIMLNYLKREIYSSYTRREWKLFEELKISNRYGKQVITEVI